MKGKNKKSPLDSLRYKNLAKNATLSLSRHQQEQETENKRLTRKLEEIELNNRKRAVEMLLRIVKRAEILRGVKWSSELIPVIETENPEVEINEVALPIIVDPPQEQECSEEEIDDFFQSVEGFSAAAQEDILSYLKNNNFIKAAEMLLSDPNDKEALDRLEKLEKIIAHINDCSFGNQGERLLGEREKSFLLQVQQLLQYLRNWKVWHDRVMKDIDAIVQKREQKYQPNTKNNGKL